VLQEGMRYPKTNHVFYVKEFLGIKDDLSNLLPKNNRKYPNLITNPLIGCLIKTYQLSISKTVVVSSQDGIDIVYTQLVGQLLNYLKAELAANINYKNEIKRKLMNCKFGSFITVFSELFVGGYLKWSGFDITFNSSKEVGQPDILSKNKFTIANEIKSYPDRESWLEDALSSMMPNFTKLLKRCSNIYLFIFVSDIKGFKKGIIHAIEEYLKTGKDVKNGFCTIMNIGNIKYAGNQGILISYPKSNAHLRFDISFDSYKDTVSIFEKSQKQLETSNLKGITWMFFPHPKGASIERRVIRYASGIPKQMNAKDIGVVLFEVLPTIKDGTTQIGIQSGADFLIDSSYSEKINTKSFNEFVDFLILKPTFLIS
jgi:hypothetical protein